jgi:hypothetical protein
MSIRTGQTVIYTTTYDNNEREGIVEEMTTLGYRINGNWYSKDEINVKQVLLDSKNIENNSRLILG